ncbi:MAG: potassium/proton antiporter [Burkholderiaceae bacterium]
MEFVNLPLLAVSAMVFASVLVGLFSTRIGFSFLLVFLLAGVLAGEDGIVGFRFDDYRLSFWVGNLALAVILLDGGLQTTFSTFRTGLRPASVLASVGVVISAAITAIAGRWFVGLDWTTAFLLGAIIGSTDAAAVFALLNRSGVTLNERVSTTLEIESGVNDPMAVYLTLAFIAIIGGQSSPGSSWSLLAWNFVQQFGLGALIGIGGGFGMGWLLNKVAARDAGLGVLALLVGSAGLCVFAAAGLAGGSGFLAVYLFGLVVANRATGAVAPILAVMDGYAWLAQAGMFLLLGLLVTPSTMLQYLAPGLAVAATLVLVARPVAVWLCLWPFRFTQAETWYISWVGLRGAVPIVLALFPLMAGTPQAPLLFNIAFMVVVLSLLLQGSTIGLFARWLGVAIPDATDERQHRAVFRDFALEPGSPIETVCSFYGLPAPGSDEAALPLGDWMVRRLRRPPVAGDSVTLGSATFVVRAMHAGRITKVGLGLAY